MVRIFLTGVLASLAGTLLLVNGAALVPAAATTGDVANVTYIAPLDDMRFAVPNILRPKTRGRNGVIDTRLRWPDRTIPYRLDSRFTAQEVEVIKWGIEEFRKTCVKTKLRTNERDYVDVTRNSEGCYSWVGRLGGLQTLNLQAPRCINASTVTHLFMHALGFYHEEQTSDRDKYVTIKWGNIQPGEKHNFEKYGPRVVSEFGETYDYSSIMHSTAYAFSKNGQPTIVPKDPNAVLGGNTLTATDIRKLNKMYGC